MNILIEQIEGNQIISIENSVSNEIAKINASIGGTLISLQLAIHGTTRELIAIPYQQKYSLNQNPFYPSGLLMPWVNRVRNGNYSFLGKNYQLPINELNLGNAIHGFMAHMPFEIIQQSKNESDASFTLKYIYDGRFIGYPFAFEAYLTYSLDTMGNFNFTMACKNTGDSVMPFAIGWHPYFQLGNNLNDLTLYFNSIEKYLSDSQMIPLKAELFDAGKGMNLKEEKPDNVYLLKREKENKVSLIHKRENLSLNLYFSAETFPYFVAFCPDNEECIALEPMTGNTDCFNTFEGLIELKVNDHFNGNVKINLREIGQN